VKTILIPNDFSISAVNSVDYALKFAKIDNARIILLYTFQSISSFNFISNVIPHYTENSIHIANEILQSWCERIFETNKIVCNYIIKTGSYEDSILETIKENKVDLIIMSAKGENYDKHINSRFVSNIIKETNCPLMVIPENFSFEKIEVIVFATDYNATDIIVLNSIVDIAMPFNAKIILLHIADGEFNELAEKQLQDNFEKLVIKTNSYKNIFFQLLADKNIEKKLLEYIEMNSTDILVVSTHKHFLIDEIFGNSITAKIMQHASIPLLVFYQTEVPVTI
jgi:nucleotide-binding universal stress UspA family protein